MYQIPEVHVSIVRDPSTTPPPVLTGSDTVFNVARKRIENADREIFEIFLLDTKNRIVGVHTVSIGSARASIVHPREVFKAAILANASAIVGYHNHPSGDPKPSREDMDITTRLCEAGKLLGIPLLDHVIVGDGQYFSFADKHLITK